MPQKTVLKPYAVDIVKELRKEHDRKARRTAPYIDLGDVVEVRPKLIITPHHMNVEYDDEDFIFQINPATLEVGDTVIIGRDPSGQPVLMGIADSAGGPVVRDIAALRASITTLKRAIKKLSVATSDDFLPKAGGTMTGDLVMSVGTKITLPDLPVNDTDAVNKAYVDQKAFVSITEADSPYYILQTDHVVFVDTSVSNVEVILPATHIGGQEFIVKNTSSGSNEILVYSDDGDTIDGDLDFTLNVSYQSITFISDGNNWSII